MSVSPNVQSVYEGYSSSLQRALVELFVEGWCASAFTPLLQKYREPVLKVFTLLFAAQHAQCQLDSADDRCLDIYRREMALKRR